MVSNVSAYCKITGWFSQAEREDVYVNRKISIYAVKNVQKKPQSFQEPNDLVLILSVQWKGLRDELCLGSCDHKFPSSTSHEDRATGMFFPGA